MSNVSDIQAKIDLDLSGFSSNMKQVQQSMGSLSKDINNSLAPAESMKKGLGGVGSAAKTAVSNVMGMAAGIGVFKAFDSAVGLVKGSIGSAFDRIDNSENFARTMEVLLGSTEAANQALQDTRGIVTGTAYGLGTATKGVQGFVTASNSIQDSTAYVKDWGNAVSFFGDGSDATFGRVVDSLNKMSTKGNVSLEYLNTAIESGIPVMQIYSRATGKTTEEISKAISSGSIKTKDFMDTMNKAFNEGVDGFPKISNAAAEAGASWKGSFDNMKSAVTRGVAGIITNIDEGLNGAGLPTMREFVGNFGKIMEQGLGKVGDLVGKSFTIIGKVVEKFQPQISAFTEGFKSAFNNVGKVLDEFLPKIQDIGNFFMGAFKTVYDIALPLFETVVEGIKTYIGILVDYWTGVFSGDNNLANSFMRVFTAIKDVAVPILEDAVSFIKEIIGTISDFWKENGDTIIEAVKTVFSFIATIVETVMPQIQNTIETVWGIIKAVFSTVLGVILGLVAVFAGLITGDFSAIWEGIKQITSSIWEGIKGILSAVFSGIATSVSNSFNGMKDRISDIWNTIRSVTVTVWDKIKTAITSPIEAAKNTISGIVDTIKGFFSNMKLKIPKFEMPPLPHFSLSGKFSLAPPSVPKLDIDWYKTGGKYSGSSVIGTRDEKKALLPKLKAGVALAFKKKEVLA